MNNIKVLWIDDEHEKLDGFKGQAKIEGIDLIPFKSRIAGLDDLEANYKLYDAVLFDAKFFEKETDVAGTENLSNLSLAKDRLLKLPKVFEPFVLTGQAKLYNDQTFSAFIPKYYKKGVAEDVQQLFIDIKEFASGQIETQIRQENPKAFEAFRNGIIDERKSLLLLDIIQNYNDRDFRKKNINVQRDLLEVILKSLNHPIPFIPNDFFDDTKNNKPNLKWCSIFFGNGNVKLPDGSFERSPVKIDEEIGSIIRKLTSSTNVLSHDNEEEIVAAPFSSNMYLLIEILEWLPGFVQTHYPNYI